jgi:hypothetical protein
LQTIVVPWHEPLRHASDVVHALPSSHALTLLAKTQPMAKLQLSVVHGLSSLQTRAAPPHVPPKHVSLVVQALPSLQGTVLLEWTQPVAGLHVSFVQTLPSLQAALVSVW